jgi:hypothetical protein
VVAVKILLAVLMLALAALAIPTASASPPEVPIETHCVADENGVAHCSTTVAQTCTYTTSGDQPPASTLACWHTAIGYCSVSPFQNPPNLWCEDYGPGDDGRSASRPPPCQTGIAQTWCDLSVGPCFVRIVPWTAWGDVYARADCSTGAGSTCHLEVHKADPTNPETWCA